MDLIVERAGVGDAGVLAALRLEMRKERETAVCRISDKEFYRCNLEFFRTRLADGSFISYIVREGDVPVACSGLSIQVHPPTYDNPSGKHGYITNMFTRPAWRHRGIAKMLLDRLTETARAEGCAQLFLNASPMGRPLYVACGFVPVDGEMRFDL